MKKILTSEAVVKTVQVEIKALTLNNKQMTLSVFRQLENEPLILMMYEDACHYLEFKGIPWGRVNYHTKHCHSYDHLHVIWQKENELRQSTVYSPGSIILYLAAKERARMRTMLNVFTHHPLLEDFLIDIGIDSDTCSKIDHELCGQLGDIYRQLLSLDQLFIAV